MDKLQIASIITALCGSCRLGITMFKVIKAERRKDQLQTAVIAMTWVSVEENRKPEVFEFWTSLEKHELTERRRWLTWGRKPTPSTPDAAQPPALRLVTDDENKGQALT